jgi:hypothetical protein
MACHLSKLVALATSLAGNARIMTSSGHESKFEAIGTASTIQFLSISEMPKLSHPILTPIVRQKSNFESNLEGLKATK